MKKSKISLLFFMLFVHSVSAPKSLFDGGIESGGYGGPFFKLGQINGQTGLFVGGQGGWIINHTFVIGGKGYGIASNVEVEGMEGLRLNFNCGGLMLEYILSSDEVLHYSVEGMLGTGNVSYDDNEDNLDENEFSNDSFFVFEPGVNAILNVTKNLRIGAGITFRYVSGVEYEGLDDSDLMGVSGQLVFKFGGF